jgi:hypothetical protein
MPAGKASASPGTLAAAGHNTLTGKSIFPADVGPDVNFAALAERGVRPR